MTKTSFYVADWRDGQMPKTEGATHVVYSDTRHRAYNVPNGEYDDFLLWVASTFCGENDPMFGVDFAGSVYDYLDEIDVSVREA